MHLASEVEAVQIDPFPQPSQHGSAAPSAREAEVTPLFPPEPADVPPRPQAADPKAGANEHYLRELRRRVALLGAELKEKDAALAELAGEDWVVSLQKAPHATRTVPRSYPYPEMHV